MQMQQKKTSEKNKMAFFLENNVTLNTKEKWKKAEAAGNLIEKSRPIAEVEKMKGM